MAIEKIAGNVQQKSITENIKKQNQTEVTKRKNSGPMERIYEETKGKKIDTNA